MEDTQSPPNSPVNHRGGTLEVVSGQTRWTADQRAALSQLGLTDATDADLNVFMHYAQRTKLDPFSRQIYMIARWDPQARTNRYTIQVGIDGFRVIAGRQDEYCGQLGPEWCGTDGVWRDAWLSADPPAAARVGVMRRDWEQPTYGVAIYREYVQHKKDGTLTAMWAAKPAHMIGKVAEALALRRAFPHDLSGIYTDDETGSTDARSDRSVVIDQAPVTADELRGDTGATAADRGRRDSPAAVPTEPQRKKMHALFRDAKITAREDRIALTSAIIGRTIDSSSDLTKREAGVLIDRLDGWAADGTLPEKAAQTIAAVHSAAGRAAGQATRPSGMSNATTPRLDVDNIRTAIAATDNLDDLRALWPDAIAVKLYDEAKQRRADLLAALWETVLSSVPSDWTLEETKQDFEVITGVHADRDDGTAMNAYLAARKEIAAETAQ